jgi:hypothetical protein
LGCSEHHLTVLPVPVERDYNTTSTSDHQQKMLELEIPFTVSII